MNPLQLEYLVVLAVLVSADFLRVHFVRFAINSKERPLRTNKHADERNTVEYCCLTTGRRHQGHVLYSEYDEFVSERPSWRAMLANICSTMHSTRERALLCVLAYTL